MSGFKGFSGFDIEEEQVGYKPSVKWVKSPLVEAPTSDLKEIPLSEVADPEFNDEKAEIKRIGKTKRTPRKYVTTSEANFAPKVLCNVNFMNVFKDLIENTIGKVKLNLNSSGNFIKKLVSNLEILPTSEYFNASNTHNLTLVDTDSVEHLFSSTGADKATVLSDWATAIGNDTGLAGVTASATGEILTLSFGTNSNVVDGYIESVRTTEGSVIDVDNFVIGAVVNVASSADATELFGSDKISGTDLQPVAIYLENNTTGEVDVLGLNHIIGVDGTKVKLAGKLEGKVLRGINASGTDYSLYISTIAGIDIDDTPDRLIDIMQLRAVGYDNSKEEAVGSNALLLNNGLGGANILIPLNGNPEIEIKELIDSHQMVNPYDEDYTVSDKWKDVSRNGSIRMGRAMFPASINGTGTLEEYASNSYAGTDGTLNLEVDGYLFSAPFNTDATQTVADLVAKINAFKVDNVQRFTATANSDAFSIRETQPEDELAGLYCYAIDASGTKTDLIMTALKTCVAQEYNSDADFVHFDQFLIGDTLGVDMHDWCEVSEVAFNLEREVKPLKSVCGPNGRLGYYNSVYTLTLEVTTTDILSNRVFEKYSKYKNNETFAIHAQSSNGVSFVFPSCVFEETSVQDNDGLVGRKFTINVNWDTNVKTSLTLPQALDKDVL